MYQNSKLYAVISYITWIGWIIALVKRDPADSLVRRHINQALCLNLMASVATLLMRFGSLFGMIGDILDILVLVLSIWGLVRAAKGSEEPLPIIGQFEAIK